MTPARPLIVPTRRALLAAAVAAPFLRLQAKTAPAFHGSVIGQGTHRYRVDKLWSRADPTTTPVKDCHEMVQVPDGRLFLLTNHPQNNILIHDADGALLGTWTLKMSGAHGLTFAGDHLYICDTSGRVIKTTLEGNIVLELPHPVKEGIYKPNESYSPTESAVAPNGEIFVADGYGSQYILRYDKDGKFIGKFGGRSTQPVNPGKFMQAHGVAIDSRSGEPLLVVTERIRNEFNWFRPDGTHVRGVYLPGAYVSRPVIHGDHLFSGVCFGARPNDYRMWQGQGFITILDARDQVVSAPGGRPPEYEDGRLKVLLQADPVFHNCHDVCVDRTGDLYVCQWNSQNVYPYKLRREA
ncbi:MAG: 6-bladed beta-propeller [Verrucomicrobia bacterium]|nr:6-bladed beta-propeller [Verrucomicrobiota bacterium]